MSGRYDLEERTYNFTKDVRKLARELKKDFVLLEDLKQVVRSSGSVGGNYIEANEALSKKDFSMRIKICRKESKESRYWLRLIKEVNSDNIELSRLIQESEEFVKIFNSIIKNSETSV